MQSPLLSSFIPNDPSAHLAGPDACLYFTTTTTKYGSIVFDGYFWNREGSVLVKSGFISQNRIIFSASTTSHGRKTDYQGHFSSDDEKYSCMSVCKTDSGFNMSRFSLKNQKLAFDPPSVAADEQVSEPTSAFFLYKQDTFQTVQEQNPSLKFSQISALISQSWENLDESMRTCYQLIYEEQVDRYKGSWVVPFIGNDPLRKRAMNLNHSEWDEEIVPEVKMWRPNCPNLVFTQIHKVVSASMYFWSWDQDNLYDRFQDFDWKNQTTWKENSSWVKAIDHIREEYKRHMEYYDEKKQKHYNKEKKDKNDSDSNANSDANSDNLSKYSKKSSHPEHMSSPIYNDRGEIFTAVMVDFANREIFQISVPRLSSDLQGRTNNIPQRMKYLIAHILREKDFDSPVIQGVLEMVYQKGEEEIDESDDEIK